MHVMGIPEVQRYKNMSLSYIGIKRYKYIEKEGHGLSRNKISNL